MSVNLSPQHSRAAQGVDILLGGESGLRGTALPGSQGSPVHGLRAPRRWPALAGPRECGQECGHSLLPDLPSRPPSALPRPAPGLGSPISARPLGGRSGLSSAGPHPPVHSPGAQPGAGSLARRHQWVPSVRDPPRGADDTAGAAAWAPGLSENSPGFRRLLGRSPDPKLPTSSRGQRGHLLWALGLAGPPCPPHPHPRQVLPAHGS